MQKPSRRKRGMIYRENHLRRHLNDGTPVHFEIWTAEIVIKGKKYRKKSIDRQVCEDWLRAAVGYTKGEGEFPSRRTHPNEQP